MKAKHFFFFSAMILAFSFVAPVLAADLTVKQGGKEIFSFKKTGDGFRAASARLFLDVAKDKAGYKLILGGKEYRMKQKESGFKIYDPAGTMIFKIKEKDEKIKILRSENDSAPWSVKLKGDQYKVMSGDRELGKVKFYGDKKKIKVKDAKGAETCEAAAARLYAAPAVALFTGLREGDALILFTALSILNR